MSTRTQIEFWDGELVARLYQHSDGYPSVVIPRLRYIEKITSKAIPLYGTRQNDLEYAATEYVVQFRLPHNFKRPKDVKLWQSIALPDGTTPKNLMLRYHGGIYVTQRIHPDVEYVYQIRCTPLGHWQIRIFNAYKGIASEDITERFNLKTGKEN